MRQSEWNEIQEFAGKMLTTFKLKDSSDESIWIISEGSPEVYSDIVRECHDGMLPDNFKYEFVRECLLAIIDNDSQEEAYDSIDSDFRTYQLNKWLTSNNERHWYINQSVIEFGLVMKESEFDIMQLIQRGQLKEKLEVMDILVNKIQEVV